MTVVALPLRERASAGHGPGEPGQRALDRQRHVTRWLTPPLASALVLAMRWGMGWRIDGGAALRREVRRLRRDRSAPLLVCPNHLTMADSALVAWALASPLDLFRHGDALPWNVPERDVFAASRPTRALAWLTRCLPISRGGDRDAIARVLVRLRHLLARGETVLVFPEGRRSRTGRIEVDANTYGVGRLVTSLPRCRVLCVYLRGERQHAHSTLPARGERFRVRFRVIEPRATRAGLRGSVEVSRQILSCLDELERLHLGEPPA